MKFKKKYYKMALCDFSDISHIFKQFHYKGDAIGGGISFCFALVNNGKIVGGAITGLPRHTKKYPNTIDIRRMACLDDSPKNSESFFLGRIIQYIASNTDFKFVLSYSDKTVGHFGTIYKASNFKNVGETAQSKYIEFGDRKYHMRSMTIDRDYSYKLRGAIKEGSAKIVTGDKKIIWIYEIGWKQKRKKYLIENIHRMIETDTKYNGLTLLDYIETI